MCLGSIHESIKVSRNCNVVLNVVDFIGDNFSEWKNNNYNDSNGVIFCYDITDRDTFEYLVYILSKFIGSNHTMFGCVIVGTKMDKEAQRQVETREGVELAAEYNFEFIETSAKDGANIMFPFLLMAQEFS